MPDHHTAPEILEQVRCETLDPATAEQLFSSLPVDEVANLHLNRADRCGVSDVVAERKDTDSLVKIRYNYPRDAVRVLTTWRSAGCSSFRMALFRPPSGGMVAIEALAIAEEMGAAVLTAYDVGVAGTHRLFQGLEKHTGTQTSTLHQLRRP